jgi:hypothetical protein
LKLCLRHLRCVVHLFITSVYVIGGFCRHDNIPSLGGEVYSFVRSLLRFRMVIMSHFVIDSRFSVLPSPIQAVFGLCDGRRERVGRIGIDRQLDALRCDCS